MTEPIPFKARKTESTIEAHFRIGEQMLRDLRSELVEAEATWRRVHDTLLENSCRAIATLDIEHGANISRLRAAIARIEKMLA
jgi:hypothetical protein